MADDYSADIDTTGLAVIDGFINGSIETDGDRDWFKAELQQYYTYKITVTWIDPWDHVERPTFAIRGSTGGYLPYGTSGDRYGRIATSFFQSKDTDPIFIDVAALNRYEQGRYQLRVDVSDDVANDNTTTRNIGLLETNPRGFAAIEEVDDEDWFRADFVQGRTYTIDLEGVASSALGDPHLKIVDAEGNIILQDDNAGTGNNAKIVYEHTRSSSVPLYIVAEGRNGTDGTYRLSVNTSDDFAADTSTTGEIDMRTEAASQLFQGDIETIDDVDWIRIKAEAGQWYSVSVRSKSTDRGAYFQTAVRGPNGSDSFQNNFVYSRGSFRTNNGFHAYQTGDYYLRVAAQTRFSFYDKDPQYEVRVKKVGAPLVATQDIANQANRNLSIVNRIARGQAPYVVNAEAYEVYLAEGSQGNLYTKTNIRAQGKRFTIDMSDRPFDWRYRFSKDALSSADALFVRGKFQGDWSKWTRMTLRPQNKPDEGISLIRGRIEYKFASTAPDYALAKDTINFKGLNAAQRNAITSIFADLNQNVNYNFTRSSSDSSEIVIGRSDLGDRAYLAVTPTAYTSDGDRPADIYININNEDLKNPTKGSKGYSLMMQAIGQALGLELDPTNLQGNQKNNYYSVMTSAPSELFDGRYAETYLPGDVLKLRQRYGTKSGEGDEILSMTNNRRVASVTSKYKEIRATTLRDDVVIRLSVNQQSYSGTAANPNNLLYNTTTTLRNARGGSGNDTLVGNVRDNLLIGGNGNDRLRGLQGNDIMQGGAGNDRYNWNLGDGDDIISDTGGVDRIGFSSFFQLSHVKQDITFTKQKNDMLISLDINNSVNRSNGSLLIKNMNQATRRVESLTLLGADGKSIGPDVSLVSAWAELNKLGQFNQPVRLTYAAGQDAFGRLMQQA